MVQVQESEFKSSRAGQEAQSLKEAMKMSQQVSTSCPAFKYEAWLARMFGLQMCTLLGWVGLLPSTKAVPGSRWQDCALFFGFLFSCCHLLFCLSTQLLLWASTVALCSARRWEVASLFSLPKWLKSGRKEAVSQFGPSFCFFILLLHPCLTSQTWYW